MFRFFTVYGPWGRPDMAPFKFTKKILDGETIDIYNHGKMRRDFTYIDDLVHSINLLIDCVPKKAVPVIEKDSISSVAPFRVVNIGNSEPVNLIDFIYCIEKVTGISARKNYMEMQTGDVVATWADNDLLEALIDYKPNTPLFDGISAFVRWYNKFTNINLTK
jgi:UDP-glucuronate 4-epimerase